MPSRSSRRTRRTFKAGAAPIAAAALALITAVGVTLGWLDYNAKVDAATSRGTSSPLPTRDSSRTEEPLVVSVLSDSHAYNDGSWFRQTVEAGAIPGAVLGAFASYPGGDTETVSRGLQALGGSDVVIVSAGTNDLLATRTPQATASAVGSLASAASRGPRRVILSLIPPSAKRPAQTAATNALLSRWAATNDVPVLDVYTAVATPAGAWRRGLSNDGVHANTRGAAIMAAQARRQLPGLLTAR